MHPGDPLAHQPQAAPRLRVLLLASADRPEVRSHLDLLRSHIQQYANIALVDGDFSADLSAVEADLAVVLGGDGSILRAAHQMGYCQRPVLGVNLGKLGFLADLLPDELLQMLPELGARRFQLVDHLMFECRLFRQGEQLRHELGLNEVAIFAGPPFAILDVELYIDSELATTYSCDGLIISTPVGSTAHSLSAGGPILRKNLEAFVISPISPHTLTNRPVVDAADRVYELVVPRPHEGTSLVVDGRMISTLTPDDRIRIERSESRFTLVQFPGRGYYRTLREKLGWGGGLKLAENGSSPHPSSQ